MKRITISMLAALALAIGLNDTAKAEYPPADFRSGIKHDVGQSGSPFGFAPIFGKLFHRNRGGCDTCSSGVCGNGNGGNGRGGAGPGGAGMQGPMAGQGTLVFPHHPFARSPRDYFMED